MASAAAVGLGALARSTAKPLAPVSASPKAYVAAGVPAQVTPGVARLDVSPRILSQALAALDRHSNAIKSRDRIAVVDFTAASSQPRLHLLDLSGGKATRLLVAHGAGSDPDHTGYLERFSNEMGSEATSRGTFLTDDYYVGKHGRSQRLIGLDASNSNALDRAIVVHSAWYADENMIKAHGKLGRSQGCFAVGENRLDDVFGFLGKGRMIFSARA